ncbi:putative invertase inhibitor [Rhodamnia argentea]|uniref:Invertase inhibitor n=1 Tax=Rhodamnia argentea TaxID=178133 RepID=A0ABM3H4U7_9MYRT|nr:putative invertase inhibitor [Rhodamnia argentea]
MNCAFSISPIFSILFLVIFRCVRSANDSVQDTRRKIAAEDPVLNFDFCVKSLGSDSENHEVDVEGLGLNRLKLLQANYTGTIEYIKQLPKQKLEPSQLRALTLCLDAYTSGEREDLTPFYKAKRYLDLNIWVSAMMTCEDTCDIQRIEEGRHGSTFDKV